MTNPSPDSAPSVSVRGEITKTPSHPIALVLMTFSGLLLVRAVLALFSRYCLGIRNIADTVIADGTIRIDSTWSFFGKTIRHRSSIAPVSTVGAVRFENRQRYLYWVVGFGALTVGAFIGIQWFLDGLHAGYPYLTAAGALAAAAGAALDIFLYLFIPKGKGRSHLIFAMGPWTVRLSGVDPEDAKRATSLVHASFRQGR